MGFASGRHAPVPAPPVCAAPVPPRQAGHAPGPARRLRSLFVSDLHLGSSGARAQEFLSFLQETQAEAIYLVGDIFDIWHVGLVDWSEAHDAILSDLAQRAAAGTRVVYLPGNHDAALRNFVGIGAKILNGAMFELADSTTHVTADGRRFLVLHGDQCDARILKWHLLTRLGSRADALLRRLDRALPQSADGRDGNRLLGLVRRAVNAALLLGNGFEGRLVRLAREGGHDGVICGHYHRAALRNHGSTAYVNCGDWVDSMTAVAETADGRLHLLDCAPRPAARPAPQSRQQERAA